MFLYLWKENENEWEEESWKENLEAFANAITPFYFVGPLKSSLEQLEISRRLYWSS